ncbi:hypothetical protein BEL04_10255 [Mucilaginibacter sp. PPCGB 2223]|uniref:hypothetical protein n=1 Tax=Mucilaginibacter sp. PPCGB 2223 TaxID=1886027 RepID=UPI00082609B7|nr:hypothetical protein [Mucilaginibacter sp. PPCGB 2223]OCX54604.1 hypothetical protein BEL04_10255 [Mucilaginibacter sp. PPCGB 2223]
MVVNAGLKRFCKALFDGFSWIKLTFRVLFFGAMLLTIKTIDIYRLTFTDPIIPGTVWLLTGLLLTPVLYRYLIEKINMTSWLLHIVFNTVTWGGILVAIPFFANYYFERGYPVTIQLQLKDKSNMAKGTAGCGNAVANVDYDKITKQLVFDCGINLNRANQVQLVIRKGILGYDVIIRQELIVK